jgi:hypothetical protein
LGGNEQPKAASIDEVDRQGPKVVTGLSAEEGVGVDGQNGSEAGPEGEEGEEQVAKKPRLEKEENGGIEESLEGVASEEDAEHHNGNGVAKAEEKNGEGDEEEQNDDEGDVVGAEEEEEEGTDGARATGKEEGGTAVFGRCCKRARARRAAWRSRARTRVTC